MEERRFMWVAIYRFHYSRGADEVHYVRYNEDGREVKRFDNIGQKSKGRVMRLMSKSNGRISLDDGHALESIIFKGILA